MSDSPPPPPPQHHHGSLLHPALLAAAQHHNSSPDLMSMKARMDMSMGNGGNDSVDRISECNSGDGPYDGMSPIISFLYKTKNYLTYFGNDTYNIIFIELILSYFVSVLYYYYYYYY